MYANTVFGTIAAMPPRTINKSEFVRSMGSTPAKDVVKKAEQRGIRLSIAHVYTIRSNANRKAAKGSAGLLVRPGRPPHPARPNGGPPGTNDLFPQKLLNQVPAPHPRGGVNSLP